MFIKGETSLKKVDDFWKKLIWETIYNFYENKTASTIDALYKKLKGISTRMHYQFPYSRTTQYCLMKKWLQISKSR